MLELYLSYHCFLWRVLLRLCLCRNRKPNASYCRSSFLCIRNLQEHNGVFELGMKLIIAGSRGITDYAVVLKAMQLSGFRPSVIVSGAARGVDLLGERYAKEHDILIDRYPVTKNDWEILGKKAGYLRNKRMAESANALVAIWDGESKGTLHMINIMKAKNLPIFVYNPYTCEEQHYN